jgi:hypothetical protein
MAEKCTVKHERLDIHQMTILAYMHKKPRGHHLRIRRIQGRIPLALTVFNRFNLFSESASKHQKMSKLHR